MIKKPEPTAKQLKSNRMTLSWLRLAESFFPEVLV